MVYSSVTVARYNATCLYFVGQRAHLGEGSDGPARVVPPSVLPDIKRHVSVFVV